MTSASAMASELRRRIRGGARDGEREQDRHRDRVHIVLGSGLAPVADAVEGAVEIGFEELGLPPSTVPGHTGRFVAGELDGLPVLVQAGRYHAYEGHPASVVVAPVRIAAELGCRTTVLTNASGGVRRGLAPGSLLLVDDHINLMWRSPLAGPVEAGEVRFPDMSAPYDLGLQRAALDAARELGIALERGTYAAVLGPNYETPAEVRMLERLGADVIGMSTVPEATVARARGLRVLAISLVTNRAAGLGQAELDHSEVLEVGARASRELTRLLRALLPRISD